MKSNLSKSEVEEKLEEFFEEIKTKTTREIKKIKKLAMSKNVPLKERRKLFCKKCMNPYSGLEKVRIKNKVKSIVCKKCGEIVRWKMK